MSSNLTENLREGRPSTATIENNISVVRLTIDIDKRVTYQQLVKNLLFKFTTVAGTYPGASPSHFNISINAFEVTEAELSRPGGPPAA
ncbi:hypothetical protein EVAR_92063_1 [Eumeta japonica]|uniref:Uncharacterized protein n=1 Tax=Eumeta variegata TaxID=151549 RepID=A0A4C1SYZ9_EUMVA|nr:hypothetical protein EVAR_92063_1 [Eumeta japonica]